MCVWGVGVTDQPEGIRPHHHPVQLDDVVVVDAVHDGRLLQEVRHPGPQLLPAQALDGHLDLRRDTDLRTETHI